MSFHNKIMNLQINDTEPRARTLNYKIGHKDARHAAAEIVNEADTTIAELLEALKACDVVMDTAAIHNLPQQLPPTYKDSWAWAHSKAREVIAKAEPS